MEYANILLRPVISEKATMVKDANNQVVFIVHPDANKIEIAKAVEKAFSVTVTGVRVVKRRSLARSRMGRVTGRIAGYKKAYVTLAQGEKIEFFEGV
ncbi:50S ribosomal protein L23 [Desulfovibrio aerotolerans]|uniref:Large ribosomal subunit protein uL23 n=1 Tax=Solidesulfovibrio aerotolerans TaxID=295255 RepID=A0A7C9MG58_9BACT|nr:50S ribosomal protein L23 [Solidesulfovibrio aerotolerans]MYL81668.1 50S ribosomal protein L23 [Solidesulfovibrio aerotolerans]